MPVNMTDCRRLSGQAYGNWYWLNRWHKGTRERAPERCRNWDDVGGDEENTQGARALAILRYRYYRVLHRTVPAETNERGNFIYRDEDADLELGARGSDRYFYDFGPMREWKQYDTRQDASYFGVWVDVAGRRTFSYCEGDRILVVCPTLESFRLELEDMERCYGPLPYCAVSIDTAGVVTQYYDARPTV